MANLELATPFAGTATLTVDKAVEMWGSACTVTGKGLPWMSLPLYVIRIAVSPLQARPLEYAEMCNLTNPGYSRKIHVWKRRYWAVWWWPYCMPPPASSRRPAHETLQRLVYILYTFTSLF